MKYICVILFCLISNKGWAIECFRKEIAHKNSTGKIEFSICDWQDNPKMERYDGANQKCVFYKNNVSCFATSKTK